MPDITKKLLDLYNVKRSVRPETQEPDEDLQLWSYRQAAAVLHCFNPEALRPVSPEYIHDKPRLLLYDDLAYYYEERDVSLFTLKPAIRREALKRFSSREAMYRALKANADRYMTPLQTMWEGYLESGTVPPAETLGYYSLTCLCQILSWLDGFDKTLPAQADVLALVRRRSVLATFEHLVISNFTGRDKELATLQEYIQVLPPAAGPQLLNKQLSRWVKLDAEPILTIFGPGGIGKSALIGRMLSDRAKSDPQVRIPFAYLAFDQLTLRIESPFTLLVEAAGQFELQFPEFTEAITLFNDTVRQFRDERGALVDRKKVAQSRSARLGEAHLSELELYRHFARLLRNISKCRLEKTEVFKPVLLTFDTFEEVQYKDRESLTGFWRMLSILQKEFPPLRIIILGRISVSEPDLTQGQVAEVQFRKMPLSELAVADRVTLLLSLGVPSREIAAAVAEQVGGNPLSLRLAANLISSDADAAGKKGIKDLDTRKWLFFQVDEQIIQGQLYKRILDHIHNTDVRKLAHPGMVLRVVSPQVILQVLAPVCNIAVYTLAAAESLFQELKREYALVQTGAYGTLVYRPEIRQAMIKLLLKDKFSEVHLLHRAAINYYAGLESTEARAEELYHRLALGEDEFWVLDKRWMQGIEQSIAASLDEYSDRVKVWLASRMNLEVPRQIFENARIADWERNITRKVKRALSGYEMTWALELLGEREDRSEDSPLFALEAKAYILMDDLESAWKVLDKGIERVSSSTNRGRLAELFWLQSQVALLRKDPLLADELLAQAGKAVENAANQLPLMHVLCHRLILRGSYQAAYTETSATLRAALNLICTNINEHGASMVSFVLPLALSMLANEFPATTRRLEKLVKPGPPVSADVLTSENLQGLEEYRESWEDENTSLEESLV